MAWAIVATIDQDIHMWQDVQIGTDITGQPAYKQEWQNTSITAGTIASLIVYDGVSPYVAPDGYKLEQVPDNAQVGDMGY